MPAKAIPRYRVVLRRADTLVKCMPARSLNDARSLGWREVTEKPGTYCEGHIERIDGVRTHHVEALAV